LNDVIAQITGVKVRETLPDTVLDDASEIEVIDLPPEELLKRLQDGKVYVPDQAARAVQLFFRKGNLTALREMSLRRAAERVDEQMQSYMQDKAIAGPWAAVERLLVCVSPSPLSERLVRSARRLAGELNCEWLAVYVETPGQAHLSSADQERVARNLQLAEELGAKAVTLLGNAVVPMILDYAHKQNVTRIIIGKPLRSHWQEFLHPNPVNQLIRSSGTIDVFVVTSSTESHASAITQGFVPHRPLARYALSLLLVAGATAISLLTQGRLSPTNLVMVYLLAVLIAALYLGRGPAILSSILGVLAFDFFIVPPYLTLAVSDTEYVITFGVLLMVGLVISELATRTRAQVEAAQHRQVETAALYDLSRDLASADGLDGIVQAVIRNVSQTFEREAVILLPEADRQPKSVADTADFLQGENELAVATWAFEHGQPAGRGTDTLPAAKARYLPLKTARATLGVLAVKPRDPAHPLSPESARLLETFATQAALALERAQFAAQAQQTRLLQATEKLQAALLNSISHDLRTPLVSITGALSSLDEQEGSLDTLNRRSLIVTAREEAEHLNRLVGNLLSMTRIESGAIRLHLQPCDLQDVVGTALAQLGKRIQDHPVQVTIPTDFPLAPLDFTLIVQVLVNVLENAAKYSLPGAAIELQARYDEHKIELEIADRGIGIPTDDLRRVFDKFYRVQRPENVSGTGLGLSISKGLVEAHNGQIFASQRPGGGTLITIQLPLKEP
jgi:two-component system sensor histidine kinase KdpD